MESERLISQAPTDTISALQYTPDSAHLLTSSWDSTLRLFSVATGTATLQHQSQAPLLDCTVLDSTTCVFGGLSTKVESMDLATGQVSALGAHEFPVKAIDFHKDSSLVFSGGWDSAVKAWDLRSGLVSSAQLPGKVYSMSVAQQPGQIVIGTSTKEVLVYDCRRFDEPLASTPSPLKYQTRCITCMPNGQGYVISSIEGRVAVEYFADRTRENYVFKCHRLEDAGVLKIFPVNTLAFHQEYGTFATGGSDRLVCVWDPANRKRLWKLREFSAPISALSFSPNGRQLAIACSYLFEEGDIATPPVPSLILRDFETSDVAPKSG